MNNLDYPFMEAGLFKNAWNIASVYSEDVQERFELKKQKHQDNKWIIEDYSIITDIPVFNELNRTFEKVQELKAKGCSIITARVHEYDELSSLTEDEQYRHYCTKSNKNYEAIRELVLKTKLDIICEENNGK